MEKIQLVIESFNGSLEVYLFLFDILINIKTKNFWVQCKGKDLFTAFDGPHQTPDYKNDGVKFVSVENISTLKTNKFISKEVFEKEYINKKPSKGDVLMTRIGDIGTTYVVKNNDPLAYYVTLSLLKPKNILGEFLSYSLNSRSVSKDIWSKTLHIAFPKKINLGEISKIKFSVPRKAEQEKISQLLSKLDEIITLEQRKYEIKNKIFIQLINSIYSNLSSFLPNEINIKEIKLEKLVDILNGYAFSSNEYISDGIPLIRISNISDYKNLVYLRFNEEYSNYILNKGDIVLSLTGDGSVIHDYFKLDKGYLNQRLAKITSKNKNILDFIYGYMFTTEFKNIFSGLATGSSQKNISVEDLNKISIKIPNDRYYIELIGKTINTIYKNNLQENEKISKLQSLKQFLLNQLFI